MQTSGIARKHSTDSRLGTVLRRNTDSDSRKVKVLSEEKFNKVI